MQISIGIADDQALFLASLSLLIGRFEHCTVSLEARNGAELLTKLDNAAAASHPDILLVDVEMPVMNGIRTAKEVSEKYPSIRLVALSLREDDDTIISMIRNGCCAYLGKDISPLELEKAIREVHAKGYYNADAYNLNYRRIMIHAEDKQRQELTDRELTFLKLACSDLTYKEIASRMHLAERTIDGYRESLFAKLNVQSRVGMVLEAIRLRIVDMKELA